MACWRKTCSRPGRNRDGRVTEEQTKGEGRWGTRQVSYLEAGIVSAKWAEDGLHVAIATVASCTMIVLFANFVLDWE